MGVGVSVAELAGVLRCVACRAPGGLLCPSCAADLRRPAGGPDVPGAARVIAGLEYEGAARALILALKLDGKRAAAVPLAAALCSAVAARGLAAAVITWVPGRRRDIRRRGFDHAEALARSVARRLGLPARRLLARSPGRRADQTSLGAAERSANLEGAFVAAGRPRVAVGLVDDLVTTGSTARACTDALLAAGAPGVEVLAACRA